MHKDIENFDSLLYRCDGLKCRHYQVLHHYLKVLDAVTEPAQNIDIFMRLSEVYSSRPRRIRAVRVTQCQDRRPPPVHRGRLRVPSARRSHVVMPRRAVRPV